MDMKSFIYEKDNENTTQCYHHDGSIFWSKLATQPKEPKEIKKERLY